MSTHVKSNKPATGKPAAAAPAAARVKPKTGCPTASEANRGAGKPRRSPNQDAWSIEGSYGGIGARVRGGLSPDADGYRSEQLRGKYKHQKYDILDKPARLPEADPAPRTDDFIEFDEVVTTVSGSSGFAIQSFDVNPGLSSTFPRSYVQSAQYQGYTFGWCEFYYRPTITNYQATGKVMMSFDLNGANSPDPSSNAEMENNTIHRDGMPHQSMGFEIAGVSRKYKYNYVRTGPIILGADPKLADVGRLYLATNGTPTGLIGELRVRGWLKAKDRLQNPTGFALPLFLTQAFIQAAYPLVEATSTEISFTFTPPTVSTGLGYAPFDDLDAINVSGWSIQGGGASGRLLCPANAVYQITANLIFYDGSNILQNTMVQFVGNDGTSQNDMRLVCGRATGLAEVQSLNGSASLLMAAGQALVCYYNASDLGGGTMRLMGGVVNIITM